jgi:hypothetical protein
LKGQKETKIKIMKYSIIKEKEGFSSQVRKYSEQKFKKDVLKELQWLAKSWIGFGGCIKSFNKSKLILVLTDESDSENYTYQIL